MGGLVVAFAVGTPVVFGLIGLHVNCWAAEIFGNKNYWRHHLGAYCLGFIVGLPIGLATYWAWV